MGEEYSKMTTKMETSPEVTGSDVTAMENPNSRAVMGSNGVAGSTDRDALLAQLQNDKRTSLIRAWSDSEKIKADNKAQKKMSSILSWESSKKATLEAELKMTEEKFEKKKAEYAEKVKNKVAMIHKQRIREQWWRLSMEKSCSKQKRLLQNINLQDIFPRRALLDASALESFTAKGSTVRQNLSLQREAQVD